MGEGKKKRQPDASKLPRVDSVEGMLWRLTAFDSLTLVDSHACRALIGLAISAQSEAVQTTARR